MPVLDERWAIRGILALLLVALLVVLVPLPVAGAEPEDRPVGVVDLHVDLSYQFNYQKRPFESDSNQYPVSELVRAGVVGVVLPLYIPNDVSPRGPRASDLEHSYVRIFDVLAKSRVFGLPGCVSDGKPVRTWLAFEGSAPLAGDRRGVLDWVSRGARLFGLVHRFDNELASSSTGARAGAFGLTRTGRSLVETVHAAGGMIDVSHASDRATDEVIELARRAGAPVVATHSNARMLSDHPRNLSDEKLKAIAATGGVIGVNFHSPFVVRGRDAKLDDVVRQIRHMVAVAGVEHVAIGSDFEGDIRPAAGLKDARGFPRLARALVDAGMPRSEVEKVFAKNALRLLCRK